MGCLVCVCEGFVLSPVDAATKRSDCIVLGARKQKLFTWYPDRANDDITTTNTKPPIYVSPTWCEDIHIYIYIFLRLFNTHCLMYAVSVGAWMGFQSPAIRFMVFVCVCCDLTGCVSSLCESGKRVTARITPSLNGRNWPLVMCECLCSMMLFLAMRFAKQPRIPHPSAYSSVLFVFRKTRNEKCRWTFHCVRAGWLCVVVLCVRVRDKQTEQTKTI